MTYTRIIPSPVGELLVAADDQGVRGLWNKGQKYYAATLDKDAKPGHLPVFDQVKAWLDGYFAGENPDFMPPLAPVGSPFRHKVWDILLSIPYGQVLTYGQIAEMLAARDGKKASAQAVGGAVGHNPISILIPCHRVVGAKGSLVGYACGMKVKTALLTLEGAPMEDFFVPTKGTAL